MGGRGCGLEIARKKNEHPKATAYKMSTTTMMIMIMNSHCKYNIQAEESERCLKDFMLSPLLLYFPHLLSYYGKFVAFFPENQIGSECDPKETDTQK